MASSSAVTLYDDRTQATMDSLKSKVEWVLKVFGRGGVIVQVWTTEQAKIAEDAGAVGVSVTEPPTHGLLISRMADPSLVKDIKRSVSIPVMARVRVGHFVEAQILEAAGVDTIDESEVTAVADDRNFINKTKLRCPFVCGARSLGEALQRIKEGAAMIRVQGELVGSGNVNETVKSVRCVMDQLRVIKTMTEEEVFAFSKEIDAPYDMLAYIKKIDAFPMVHYAAGGIVTPADAALMVQLGSYGVFLGSEVFQCEDPSKHLRSIVQAVSNYDKPSELARLC